MDRKQKTTAEQVLIKKWQEMKIHRNQVAELTDGTIGKSPENIMVVYKCVDTVLNNILFYEEEDTEKELVFKKDFTSEELISKMREGVDTLNIILREISKSYTERLEAIANMRKLVWGCVENDKEKIISVFQKLTEAFIKRQPVEENRSELMLIYKCIVVVFLELSMKEAEVSILEKIYNS